MAIIDLTTTSDTTDRTGAILSAFAAGNDVRLGNGQFHLNPGSGYGLVLTGDHAGRTLYLGDTTSITREAAVGNANPVLSHIKNYIYNAIDAMNCPGFRCVWEHGTPGAVDASTGPSINANGAYSGIRLGEAQTVSGVRITQHSFKGIDAFGGNCLVEDYYSASDKGVPLYSGETKTATNDIRPKPLQFDSQSVTKLGPVIVRRIKIGPHPNSTEGLNLKFTSLQLVLIEDVVNVGGSPKAGNGRSLILGENLGRVVCKRFEMPNGIAAYPDTDYGSPVTDAVELHDCVLGGGHPSVGEFEYIWLHLLAKEVYFYRGTIANVVGGVFAADQQRDDSAAGLGADFEAAYYQSDKLELLYMEDTVIRTHRTNRIQAAGTQPDIFRINASAARLTGRVELVNVTRLGPNANGIKWSNHANAEADFAAGLVSRNTTKTRRDNYMAGKSRIGHWPLNNYPMSDADTISDAMGNTDLTLST